MPANLESSAVATGLEKVSFHSTAEECSNYCTIVLTARASKVMLKIVQATFQQYMNQEPPDVQPGFRRGRGTRDQNCQHPLDHRKSKRGLEKHLLLLYWLCQSLWLCGSQQTVANSLGDRNTIPLYLPPEKSVLQVKKHQLEPDMEQQTGSESGKVCIKAVYCHPVYLTYMQSTSSKMPGWMNHKLE